RGIARKWVKGHRDVTPGDLIDLLDSLYEGRSHDERSFGGKLLEYLPRLRRLVRPDRLDRWLTGAEGWLEVDSLCQGAFTAADMLSDWPRWETLLRTLATDEDVHKRRASLVLLTKVVKESDDSRLADLAFENIDRLKGEKDPLITKAVSWLLRDLIEKARTQVEDYLAQNGSTIPRIAEREVTNKLRTGRK
ncbi:MAG: DNA alkylation repair protein, partial [Dehalococcoidia bacterium]|nr:DNA alkylation repair protein [Dehalococcoidia bacterium]